MRHYIANRLNVLYHSTTDSGVREQAQRWREGAERLEREVRADMVPVMVQSKGRLGTEYQSLTFFQRRMAL